MNQSKHRRGRPLGEKSRVVLEILSRESLDVRSIAERAQLSRRDAMVHVYKMTLRGEVRVSAFKRVEWSARPVKTYTANAPGAPGTRVCDLPIHFALAGITRPR